MLQHTVACHQSAHIHACLLRSLFSTPRPERSFKKSSLWADKMAQQQLKLLVSKSGDFRVIPRIHIVETLASCPLTLS